MTTPHIAPPDTRIGHVHLKVSDLDRALAFYSDILGFPLTQRYGRDAAFLGAGGYHHHIGLNTWESKGGQPPAPGTTVRCQKMFPTNSTATMNAMIAMTSLAFIRAWSAV